MNTCTVWEAEDSKNRGKERKIEQKGRKEESGDLEKESCYLEGTMRGDGAGQRKDKGRRRLEWKD